MNPFTDGFQPQEAILIVIAPDGTREGWRVINPSVRWEITGYPGGSAHGVITAQGEFHKVRRSAELHPLENPDYVQLHSPQPELEAGS